METDTTSRPPDEAGSSTHAPAPDVIARGYELTRISFRSYLIVIAVMLVIAIALHLADWYLLRGFLHEAREGDRPVSLIHSSNLANHFAPLQPSGPAHDTNPAEDLAAMRSSENAVFSDIGWLDPRSGSVAVPSGIVQRLASRSAPTTRPGGGGPQ